MYSESNVVGQRIQPVIESLAALKKLLRGERHENRRAGSGQSALNLHLIDTDRQRGHQPFLLLEVETLERTVVLPVSYTHLKVGGLNGVSEGSGSGTFWGGFSVLFSSVTDVSEGG